MLWNRTHAASLFKAHESMTAFVLKHLDWEFESIIRVSFALLSTIINIQASLEVNI